MRMLITGSGGRLGRLLYAARGRGVAASAEIVFQSRKAGRDVQWKPEEPVARLPKCDAVVALWGATAGSAEELAVNAGLVETSRQVAQSLGARAVFHLSSAAIYGPGVQLTEAADIAAHTPYGVAKAAMERSVRGARSEIGAADCILRLANVVGADSLAVALAGNAPVTLDKFADGHGPMRSYIGASDLLRVLCGLADPDIETLPDALNIAAPEPVAMQDLASAACKDVVWRPAPSEALQEVSLDTKRMQRLLPEIRPTADAKALVAELNALKDAV